MATRSTDHGQSLARELAEAARISEDKAKTVLEVLHVDKLQENLDALGRVLEDSAAVNVLGLSGSATKELTTVARGSGITIDNLRVGIKPTGRAASAIA